MRGRWFGWVLLVLFSLRIPGAAAEIDQSPSGPLKFEVVVSSIKDSQPERIEVIISLKNQTEDRLPIELWLRFRDPLGRAWRLDETSNHWFFPARMHQWLSFLAIFVLNPGQSWSVRGELTAQTIDKNTAVVFLRSRGVRLRQEIILPLKEGKKKLPCPK